MKSFAQYKQSNKKQALSTSKKQARSGDHNTLNKVLKKQSYRNNVENCLSSEQFKTPGLFTFADEQDTFEEQCLNLKNNTLAFRQTCPNSQIYDNNQKNQDQVEKNYFNIKLPTMIKKKKKEEQKQKIDQLNRKIRKCLINNQQNFQQMDRMLNHFIDRICLDFDIIFEKLAQLKNTLITQIEDFKIQWHSNLKHAQNIYLNSTKQILHIAEQTLTKFTSPKQELTKIEDKLQHFEELQEHKKKDVEKLKEELQIVNKTYILHKMMSDEQNSSSIIIETSRSQMTDYSLKDFIQQLNI